MEGTVWVFAAWEALARGAEQVEQSSRVSISRFAERPSALKAPSSSASVPLHPWQRAHCRLSEALGTMLFAGAASAAFIQPHGCSVLGKGTAPSHALDSTIPSPGLSPGSAAPSSPRRRAASSEARIWKPLKDSSAGRASPPHLRWG